MKCVICKYAETKPGTTTVTLEHDGCTYIVKGVPAQACFNCGGDYVNESVAGELLTSAAQIAKAGAQVDIRQYKAA